jgi:phage gp29-like protein
VSDEQPTFNLAVIEAAKLARFDPLRNFDAEKLTRALDLFRSGRLRDLALVIDAQEERDDTLACVVPKAKSAVARHGWDILVSETAQKSDSALAEKQKQVLRDFYNGLRVTSALDQDELGGVSLLLRQMMDAKSKRYAVHNIVWKPGKAPTATLWFTPLWFFENSTGKLRFIADAYGWDGQDMAADEWLVTKGTGVGIACAVAWMYKHMSLRDWVLYNFRHGLPGVEGVTDATPGTPQWENMVRAVNAAAANFRWVRNRTEEIKPIDFGGKGELPFAPLVERMDRALASLWRGADLGTMSKTGQAVGSNPQESETDLIEQDDAQWLSETLNLKLDRLVIDYVFGPEVPALAYFKVRGKQAQNVKQDLEVDAFLVGSGFPISKKQAAERYARPLPDLTDTDLLTKPVAAPAIPTNQAARSAPAADAAAAVNEVRPVDSGAAVFQSNARRKLSQAQVEAVQPVLDRLAALKELPADQFANALQAFRTDLPRLFAEARLHSPDIAAVWEQVLGTALVDGLAELPAQPLKK